mgnify:CR=1 FL=1
MFASGCANKTEEPTIENKRVTVKDESNGYKSIRFTFEVDGNEYEAYEDIKCTRCGRCLTKTNDI